MEGLNGQVEARVDELEEERRLTLEAYHLVEQKNREAFDEDDRIYDEADCIPD